MDAAAVGVVENGNSADVVTIGPGPRLLDRRRIDLTPPGTPTHPHHHEGSWAVGRYPDTPGRRDVTLPEAVALVERVHALAVAGAHHHLAALAATVDVRIAAIALRACPELPATIEARIRDNRAQTMADTVMYRQILADAARHRGWTVHWYDRDTAFDAASAALGRDVAPVLAALGEAAGPPWRASHKLAAAAALSAP